MKATASPLLLSTALLLAEQSPSFAQSSTWTLNGTGDWSTPGNWSGNVVADGANNTATFQLAASGTATTHLDSDREIGNLTFNGGTGFAYVLDDGGNTANVLTLTRSSGTPTITVANSTTATIGATLTGSNGLTTAAGGSSSSATLVLTGVNTYSGTTTITSGMVQISSDANFGSSLLTVNHQSGGIRFGAAVNDLRAISFGASGGIIHTNGFDVTYSSALSGTIGATRSFYKNGLGTLAIAGSNTISGAGNVKVGSGWLQIDSAAGLGSLSGTMALDNSFGVGSAGGIRFGSAFNDLPSLTIGGNGSSSAGGRLDTNGFDVNYGGTVTTLGGSSNILTKDGAGTLTLSGALVSGTGTIAATKLVINGGTLALDKSAGGVISATLSTAADALTLRGGAFSLKGTATGTTSQTLGGITLAAGASSLSANGNGGDGTTLTIGSITEGGGSTVNFVTSGSAAIVTTGTNVTNGIMGRRYVSNGQDWATVNSGTIGAYSGYTPGLPASVGSGTTNYLVTGSATLTGNLSANTLKINDSAPGQSLDLGGKTLSLVGNALLYTGSNGYLITSGTLPQGGETVFHQYGTGTLTLAATLNGANLTKTGPGKLVLSSSNGYTSTTYVSAGILSITNNNQLGVVGNGASVNLNGGTLQATSTLTLDNAGANKRSVVLGGNGGTIDVTGTNRLTVSGTISTDSNLNNVSLAGWQSGLGSLTKTGAGTLVLSGSNTYGGKTSVNEGTLLVAGSIVNSATRISGSATLGGSGTTGSVTVDENGVVTPGDGVGVLNTGAYKATSAAAKLSLELNGTTQGTQYDQLNVTGTVSLNGQIQLTLGFAPTANVDKFFVILNDGADAVTGTFAGLSEGSLFSAAGNSWQIFYAANATGGTLSGGNDVALLVVPEPSTLPMLLGGLGTLLSFRRIRRRSRN